MLRAISRILVGAVMGGLLLARASAALADDDFSKDIDQLNKLTGSAPMTGALKSLQDEPDRAKKLFGFEARRELRDGIRETVAWFTAHRDSSSRDELAAQRGHVSNT